MKEQIDLDFYVEVEINDNINFRQSDDEKGKFFHQNLIYGYDDDKQCFYTLFYKMGRNAKGIVTYAEYESERNLGGSKFLYMLRYNPYLSQRCYLSDSLILCSKDRKKVLQKSLQVDGVILPEEKVCVPWFGSFVRNFLCDFWIEAISYFNCTGYVFRRSMLKEGKLFDVIRLVVGEGAERGIGLLCVLLGICTFLWGIIGIRWKSLMNMEDILPDAVPGAIIYEDKDRIQEQLDSRL